MCERMEYLLDLISIWVQSKRTAVTQALESVEQQMEDKDYLFHSCYPRNNVRFFSFQTKGLQIILSQLYCTGLAL